MKNSGFSVIELVVVIAILSILIAIAGLYSREMMERYQVEGQIKEMYADVMNARVSALQRNRVFFVTLAANQYAIYEDVYSATNPSSPDGDGVLQTANDRLVTQKTLRYTLAAGFPASFSFTTNGLLSSTTGFTISVSSTANPATDCIALATTRVLMGKMNGTNSIPQ
jgi:prepilin-type N-terminal cleavage/methylation domain-containing protein